MNIENKIAENLKKLGIEELNALQGKALKYSGVPGSFVLLSPTGTGKTLAYLLPLLEELASDSKLPGKKLVLVPARELAIQVNEVLRELLDRPLSLAVYGGHSLDKEINQLRENWSKVIIGTPGRILDHIGRETIKPIEFDTLIIDEFDKALEFGFQEEMQQIIDSFHGLKKRVLLSATDADEIPVFVGAEDVVRIDMLAKYSVADRLYIEQVNSPDKDKIQTLHNLLVELGSRQAIVFCNHRESVDRVANLLSKKHTIVGFHGGMEQDMRERALFKFKNKCVSTLVATDLAGRGLDIPEVEQVIHYHLPINEETFTHRNGRTARWDRVGKVSLIVSQGEELPSYVQLSNLPREIADMEMRSIDTQWECMYLGKGKRDKISKFDVVGFLYKQGKLQKEELGSIEVFTDFTLFIVRKNKVKSLINNTKGCKIKGQKTVIEVAY